MSADGYAVSHFRWPETTGPLWVSLYFDDLNGRRELVGVEVWAAQPPATRDPRETDRRWEASRAITPETLREITIGALVNSALRDRVSFEVGLLEFGLLDAEMNQRIQETFSDESISILRRTVGERGRHLGPEHYQAVADAYTAAFARHLSPLAEIAELWGVNKNTAGRWVHVARNKHGFLPPTAPGIAAAVVTPKSEKGSKS